MIGRLGVLVLSDLVVIMKHWSGYLFEIFCATRIYVFVSGQRCQKDLMPQFLTFDLEVLTKKVAPLWFCTYVVSIVGMIRFCFTAESSLENQKWFCSLCFILSSPKCPPRWGLSEAVAHIASGKIRGSALIKSHPFDIVNLSYILTESTNGLIGLVFAFVNM